MLRARNREKLPEALIGIQAVMIGVAGCRIHLGCNRRAERDWENT
jgi:hypothetical protein